MLRGTRRLVNVKAALVLATGVALICPTPAWPQANSATLYGSVTDPAGAVVPAAVVSLAVLVWRAHIWRKLSCSDNSIALPCLYKTIHNRRKVSHC